MDILGIAAIWRVRLDINAVRAVVEVEVVDVAGAHERVECRSNLAERNAHGFSLLAIYGYEKLWVVRGEGCVHAGEPGAGDTALTDESMGDTIDVAKGVSARVLQNELEAADGARSPACDGRGSAAKAMPPGNAEEELWPDVGNDGFRECIFRTTCLVRSLIGLSGAKMRPEFGELPPASEKPMTEKVPKTPSFWRTTAETLSAKPKSWYKAERELPEASAR